MNYQLTAVYIILDSMPVSNTCCMLFVNGKMVISVSYYYNNRATTAFILRCWQLHIVGRERSEASELMRPQRVQGKTQWKRNYCFFSFIFSFCQHDMFSKNLLVLVSISWNVNKLCFNYYCAFILFAAVTMHLVTLQHVEHNTEMQAAYFHWAPFGWHSCPSVK